MKTIDEDTRNELKIKRLLSLETDNYNDEISLFDTEDAEYVRTKNESTDKDTKLNQNKNKLHSNIKGISGKWFHKKPRSLEKIIDQHHQNIQNKAITSTKLQPNIISVLSNKSRFPDRKFCSVCGSIGNYSCLRCGIFTCCIKCSENHKETRCLKVSFF